MKKLNLFVFSALTLGIVALSSCKKDDHDHDHNNQTGMVVVKMEHVWGMNNTPFSLNSSLVHPMNQDTMTFTTFKYYISNFKLKKSDGTWWTHPESYFLVDQSIASTMNLNLGSIPTGEYTEMSYILGVDSIKNVSGAQSGALSTANNMFWSWNSGYIMVKAEGTSPQSANGSFAFHLGGFSGTNKIVTQNTVSFSSNALTVSHDKSSEIHMTANPAKLFHTDPLSTGTMVMMPGIKAKSMALNFYGSFTFDHLVE
jgi:hypothetical protein